MNVSPENAKPILLASLLCDNILQEKDGTLSAIRIVETVTVNLPNPPPEIQEAIPAELSKLIVPAFVRLKLLVCIKAGDFRGHVTVHLRIISPSGKAGPLQQMGSADFSKPENGLNVIVELNFAIKRVGLAWVEVIVNDEERSRIPLTFHLAEGSAPLPEIEPDSPETEQPAG